MQEFVFDWLRQHAENTPDKEALVCGDQRLTYADFNRVSDQIAHWLTSAGVGKGDRVGVSMKKGVEYVCTLFGVMKTGGCYVPIDDEAPAPRMVQIIDDCDIAAMVASDRVLTQLAGAGKPAGLTHAAVVAESDHPEMTFGSLEVTPFDALRRGTEPYPRRADINERDLIYILYTSGSTGKPKGVMLTHQNVAVFMKWCAEALDLGPDDRILNTAPFTFDISGLDMFNAVMHGATLFVVRDQRMINTVLACISQERITFVSTVPTIIGAMVQRPRVFQRYDLGQVHTFISGAALCPPVFMQKLHEFLPEATLYNLYGPTEATIYCLYHAIDPAELDGTTPIPIGIPYENTEAFVVREDGTEAAPGETGELVLRGAHIAAGYFRNPEKTDEAFRNHPLYPHLNERVYYTGDVAKKDEDGVFHFLGRKDDLIKSRGYRIELEEITVALSAMAEQLEEFTAVAIPDQLIENKIVGAVVLKDGVELTAAEIQAFCKTKIPAYMVPEEIVFLDALPKTSSGKISRKEIVRQLQERAEGS